MTGPYKRAQPLPQCIHLFRNPILGLEQGPSGIAASPVSPPWAFAIHIKVSSGLGSWPSYNQGRTTIHRCSGVGSLKKKQILPPKSSFCWCQHFLWYQWTDWSLGFCSVIVTNVCFSINHWYVSLTVLCDWCAARQVRAVQKASTTRRASRASLPSLKGEP